MTITQLLDLGEDLKSIPDDVLKAHLLKYFPQTRPKVVTSIASDDDGFGELNLPDSVKEAMAAAGLSHEPPPQDDGLIKI